MTFLIVLIGWIFSLCLHEFSHALVAYYGGDFTVREKGYLTLDIRRYTDVAFPHQPPAKGPLRVLVVTASPPGTPPLSAEEETEQIIRRLQKGLGVRDSLRLLWRHLQEPRSLPDFVRRLLRGRRFEVAPPLHHATRAALQERLAEANVAGEGFHVVHFIGHGQATPEGSVLLFEDDERPDPVPAEALAEMLDEPALNLVVLNACETASSSDLFQSVAEATVRRGIPAVIGMQVPVLDGAASVGLLGEPYPVRRRRNCWAITRECNRVPEEPTTWESSVQ